MVFFSLLLSLNALVLFAQNQLACALALQSSIEYKHWLFTYVRKLSTEGERAKLTELCDWLLGAPHATGADLLVLVCVCTLSHTSVRESTCVRARVV